MKDKQNSGFHRLAATVYQHRTNFALRNPACDDDDDGGDDDDDGDDHDGDDDDDDDPDGGDDNDEGCSKPSSIKTSWKKTKLAWFGLWPG